MRVKSLITTIAIIAVIAIPQFARANSDEATSTGAGAAATVNLNFRIEMPAFIFFQVGAPGGPISEVLFDLSSATNLGDGTPIGASGGTGVVPVIVRSNAGAVTLAENPSGGGTGLTSGPLSIPWSEITAVSSAPGALDSPQLSNAGGNTEPVTVTAAPGITSYSETWTYSFANTTLYDAATYTGGAVYAASIP